MTTGNEQPKAGKYKPAQRRWTFVVAEFAFLITGVCLTLAGFLFLNMFVTQLVDSEYERTAENTVSTLSKEFSDLERALHAAAALLSVSTNDEAALEKIIRSDPAIRKFDQIIFLSRDAAGAWSYRTLYSQPGALFALKPDRRLPDQIAQNNITTDRSFFENKAPAPAGLKTQPFALVQPAGAGGFVIGAAHAGAILDQEWIRKHDQAFKIAIRDMNANYDLFHFVRRSGSDQLEGIQRVYEFSFGGHRLEARTEYAMDQKAYFLMTIPYFVIIFGFIITAAGTLYIHGAQRQALHVSSINDALGQKNRQLQKEMAKRERLSTIFKKSEAENQSLIDSVSDIIFETDTFGKILFLNATWFKITGFEPEQSKGLNLFNMLHPQDQDKQRKDFQTMVRGAKQNYRSFTRLRTADGTFRAVEISFSMTRQDEHRNLRVVGTLTDVEERRRAERALGEAEKKYRAIVENAAGGIFQLTPEGVYLSANPALARILGYSDPDDLLRSVKNANESIYFNNRERQYFLKELESSGVIHNYETQIIRKDASRIWVNENVRAVRDDTGHTLYYEGSLEDITQRKDAEIALREAKVHSDLASRAKSEFLTNMSHELRTPLNSIIGFSEMIKNEISGPVGQGAYKDYALEIFESGKRLLNVINEILDISKIEAGERYLNDDIVDLSAVIEGCLQLLESKAKASDLIVANMLKDVPKIVGEEVAIKQVLINLLSNAIKFTPAGGRVTITNDTDAEGSLRITITDTGVGLDESELEKALSPFGQVNNDLSRSNTGTGLGLTLAQALIGLHDGRLEVFSQKGIGTSVAVVFPADRVSKNRADQSPAAPKGEKTV